MTTEPTNTLEAARAWCQAIRLMLGLAMTNRVDDLEPGPQQFGEELSAALEEVFVAAAVEYSLETAEDEKRLREGVQASIQDYMQSAGADFDTSLAETDAALSEAERLARQLYDKLGNENWTQQLEALNNRYNAILEEKNQAVQSDDPDALRQALSKVHDLRAEIDRISKELRSDASLAETDTALSEAEGLEEYLCSTLGFDNSGTQQLQTLNDRFCALRDEKNQAVQSDDPDALQQALNKIQNLRAEIERVVAETRVDKINGIMSCASSIHGGATVAMEPEWNANDVEVSPEWKEAVAEILKVQPDSAFLEAYNAKSDQAASALAKIETVKTAVKNWAKWSEDLEANTETMKSAINEIVASHSAVLGLDPSTPVSFDEPFNGDTSGLFANDPPRIKINFQQSMFYDFREVLDSLTHENTHAYQHSLVQKLDRGDIGRDHPDYMAALSFKVNSGGAYITPEATVKYDDTDTDEVNTAYRRQSTETHAFGAGARAGKAAYDLMLADIPTEERDRIESENLEKFNLAIEKANRNAEEEAKREAEELRLLVAEREEDARRQQQATQARLAAEQAKADENARRQELTRVNDEIDELDVSIANFEFQALTIQMPNPDDNEIVKESKREMAKLIDDYVAESNTRRTELIERRKELENQATT